MAFTRDIYYQALFNRLRAKVPDVMTWSRRAILFSEISPSMQPACLVLVANQDSATDPGGPTIWTLGADVWLLVKSTNQQASLDSILNNLVDLVERALLRDVTDVHVGPYMETDRVHTTLGGLVSRVFIAGPIEFTQGEGGEQAQVVIPIDMEVLGDG